MIVRYISGSDVCCDLVVYQSMVGFGIRIQQENSFHQVICRICGQARFESASIAKESAHLWNRHNSQNPSLSGLLQFKEIRSYKTWLLSVSAKLFTMIVKTLENYVGSN